MLSNTPFYFGTIRKLVAVFGTLFNNIRIERTRGNGQTQTIKIPIRYGRKEFWYQRVIEQEQLIVEADGDPTVNKDVRITLPRMAFEYNNPEYDANRKLNTIQKRVAVHNGTKFKVKQQYQSVPYTMGFQLHIMARNEEDALKIIEQILPYFTPSLNTQIHTNDPLTPAIDVPYTIESITDNTEPAETEKARIALWTISFNAHFEMYGPISDAGIIRTVIVNYFSDTDTDTARRVSRTTITPNPASAGPGDDYTITATDEFFTDAQEFDEDTGTDDFDLSSSSSSQSESSELSSSSSNSSSST